MKLESTTSAARSIWSMERSALAADVLNRRGSLRLRVYGESMLPTIWPGDVVEIASCSLESVKRGEIVLAMRDGRLFLHRFLSKCAPDGFLLRGDSMPGCDSSFPAEALLGRLVRNSDATSVRTAGGAALSRAVGLLLCYSGVARRLALKLHGWRTASANERGVNPASDLRRRERSCPEPRTAGVETLR